MNSMQKMTDKRENLEFLREKNARHNPFFKIKSHVKVGFELQVSIDFDQIAQSVSNAVNTVKSIYSDGI